MSPTAQAEYDEEEVIVQAEPQKKVDFVSKNADRLK